MGECANLWFHDTISPYFVQMHGVRDIMYSGRTRFQLVQIVETASFGKCLILDGKLQSSEKDEFIYHEALVHPALITHPGPANVFIAGGGEGATLREALRHRLVERVVMVDIDQEAVDICRRLLPSLNQQSFDDRRAHIFYLDAKEYLANSKEQFDVMILDLTDPIEEGLSYLLYTKEFYRVAEERLAPRGILCVQAGSCNWGETGVYLAVHSTLRSVFSNVSPYQAHVPSFGGEWGFILASQDQELNPVTLSAEEVDGQISTRLSSELQFYDGLCHRGMFCLPLYLRRDISRSHTVIANDVPLATR
jgi:spermidine synthase